MMTVKRDHRTEAGITLIETAMAAGLLIVGSLGLIGLIFGSIATNNRSKLESTQTMLGT
jgi:Tfp pilus assembly protein PilV